MGMRRDNKRQREPLDELVAGATSLRAAPLCPEIALHLGEDVEEVWRDIEAVVGLGTATPYWSVAWPGGQAVARWLLDNPHVCRGRRVLDFGTGCGIAAIAAAKGGATVEASEVDPIAARAALGNARENGVELTMRLHDLIGTSGPWDMVLAADLWYERFLAGRVTPWLRGLRDAGVQVVLGDPGRAFFPRSGLVVHAIYKVGAETVRVCEMAGSNAR